MGRKFMLLLLQLLLHLLFINFFFAQAQEEDFSILQSLQQDWKNVPPDWYQSSDPCGPGWTGVTCTNSRVTKITLSSIGLSGQLGGHIAQLFELQILDLSYNQNLTGSLDPAIGNLNKLTTLILVGCNLNGPIPDTIGSLKNLVYLSLNSNHFSGSIPASIGEITNLYWLDLGENELTGTIPVSGGTSTTGLDLLTKAKHFHFGGNQLSGQIPPQLFSSNMTLKHVLLEKNKLMGAIPSTLGLVQSLEVVRLDRNALTGNVPANINNLTSVNELFLSNNKLTGSLPKLTGLSFLNYLDISNNSFTPSDIPSWFSTLQALTTLVMESTGLIGRVPVELFSIPQMQTIVLKNNQLNGTLNIGSAYSSQLQLVDMQGNMISDIKPRGPYTATIILVNNPICEENREPENGETEGYCTLPTQTAPFYSTPPNNCNPHQCKDDQVSSPNCKCAYPYNGTLHFRAPSFSLGNLTNYATLERSIMASFQKYQLPVDTLSLSNATRVKDSYLLLSIAIFPSVGNESFNHSGISSIAFMFSNHTFTAPHEFGPYYFIGDKYDYFSYASPVSQNSVNTEVIIGAVVGGCGLVLLLIFAGIYAFRQKGRAERAVKQNNPFALWDTKKDGGSVPQLKGTKAFTFEEIRMYTNNFSGTALIGTGGYGMVYRGSLPGGQLVAVKRAQQGSKQGGLEFKTEIELLSRVHHKNLVSLVGFCFDKGEQMLVYEYIANGTLKDSLAGRSGIRLDWTRRLRLALGAARGLQYLHVLADPPIIHRDIKTNNILLDERLNAKVADFGLSKPMADVDRTHVSTQVKGTMGYMDPEYYMTNQLTEKSDVYSFGVVMLELLTGRSPIEKGKYIVREVKQAMDRSKDLYNLHELLDPIIASTGQKGLEKFVDIALRCVEEMASQRPTMSEVVKEIEKVMELAGLNPNAESASTSASYSESASKSYENPYTDESLFAYSGGFLSSKLEAK